MNSKMAEINDLPIELYKFIFSNYLSIRDLFNCRLVNKKFKFATYESVQKLVIGELDGFENTYWLHNNELIDDDHVISLKCFKEMRSIFNLDQSLKYLRIGFNQYNYLIFDLNRNDKLKTNEQQFPNLNNLINLEFLEIDFIPFSKKSALNLKNLKYLKLKFYPICILNTFQNAESSSTSTYELNTPKLEKIQLDYGIEPEILIKSNPESIKHLIVNCYGNELKQFKNLEIIELEYLSLDENLLSFFNDLKQLKIYDKNGFTLGLDKLEFKNHLIKILEESEKLNRNIDIYLFGVKIINKNQLKNFESCENHLKFQLNNYDLFHSNIPMITELKFCELNNYYKNLKNDLPSSFFDKYQNISHVNVYQCQDDKRIDADNLNWFLNNCKYLERLTIDNVSLDQNFFNNLPNTIKVLNIFDRYINHDRESLYLNINFDLVLKLIKLIEFYQGNWNIDLFDLTLKLFSNFKYIKKIQFDYNKELILIEKRSESSYSLFSDDVNYNQLNYDQLAEELSKLRSIRKLRSK